MAANLPNPGQPIWRGPYYGNAWGLRNYLKAALDEVGTKIQVEVTGETPGKKEVTGRASSWMRVRRVLDM